MKRKKVKDEELQSLVAGMIEDAIDHYEERIESDQTKATDYFWGRQFGNEEEGRSKVVDTTVRDAVDSMMPSLVRVLLGGEPIVEFLPRGSNLAQIEQAVEEAKQKTDYVRYIVSEESDGYVQCYSALQDALVRRIGVFKWRVDKRRDTHTTTHSGLTADMVALLQSDEEVEKVEPIAVEEVGGESLFEVRVTRVEYDNCPSFEAVPPEEFVYTPTARSLNKAPLVAHVREMPAGELIALGIDEDIVHEAAGKGRRLSSERLEDARSADPYSSDDDMDTNTLAESMKPVVFVEAYALVDSEDGTPERRMFWCVGPDYKIVSGDDVSDEGEPVDEVPFATITPYLMAHEIAGMSVYDKLGDLQLINSQLMRGMLNSLVLALDQVTEVVDGEVNMQDFLNKELGRVVRVRRPGQMREVPHSFVGGEVLAVLNHFSEVKENRVGFSKAAAGLDADALQSSTKAAVAATITASAAQGELVARNIAEGFRALFKGLLRLIVQHQSRPRVIQLRGKWVEMDPRSWNATMDTRVNVALGSGPPEEKLQRLLLIAQSQQELKASGSPLVTDVELRNTFARWIVAAGFPNPAEFIREWGPEQEQERQQQMAQQPPPPDPTTMLAQIEQAKVQAQAQTAGQKNALEAQKAQAADQRERERNAMQDDRERDKIARDFALRSMELELKYKAHAAGELASAVEQDRAAQAHDMDMVQRVADIEATLTPPATEGGSQ